MMDGQGKSATDGNKRASHAIGADSPDCFGWYPGLLGYCRFLAQNGWDGEDLAQEASLKAIAHYSKMDLSLPLVKKIAYHLWIDLLRARKQEHVGIQEEIPQDPLKEGTGYERAAVIANMLSEKLTPKQAVAFLLKEGFQYPIKEIASMLRMTEEGIKALLFRARARLKQDMSVERWEEEDLEELLGASIQAEDPAILVERIGTLPALAPATVSPYTPNAVFSLKYAA